MPWSGGSLTTQRTDKRRLRSAGRPSAATVGDGSVGDRMTGIVASGMPTAVLGQFSFTPPGHAPRPRHCADLAEAQALRALHQQVGDRSDRRPERLPGDHVLSPTPDGELRLRAGRAAWIRFSLGAATRRSGCDWPPSVASSSCGGSAAWSSISRKPFASASTQATATASTNTSPNSGPRRVRGAACASTSSRPGTCLSVLVVALLRRDWHGCPLAPGRSGFGHLGGHGHPNHHFADPVDPAGLVLHVGSPCPRPPRAGPPGLRELLRHRSGEPGDLHPLRPGPPGRAANRGRAALLPVPFPSGPGLLGLRADGALRDLPGNRAAMVPALPAPAGRVLSLRTP